MVETPTEELIAALRARAESYRLSGPSAEHTAQLLDLAADRLSSALAAERDRNERLAGALRPFANIVGSSLYEPDGSGGDAYRIYLAQDAGPHEFTGADVERARAALSQEKTS